MKSFEPAFPKTVERICYTLFAIAILVMLGWSLDNTFLKAIHPSFKTMKFNNALFVLFFTFSIWLTRKDKNNLWRCGFGYLFAALAFAIGFLTLAESILNINLGIDEFFFADPPSPANGYIPGRVAPATSLFQTLLAGTYFLSRYKRFQVHKISTFSTILIGLISFQAFLSYLFGVTYIFGSAFYAQMALMTTVSMVLCCVALLLSQMEKDFLPFFMSRSAGALAAQKLLAAAIMIPPVVFWLKSWGVQKGWFDADFAVVFELVGETGFLLYFVWRNSLRLHKVDLARERSEFNFRQISEAIPQLVWTALPDGRIDYCNQRLIDLFNLKLSEVQNFGWLHSIHPDDQEAVLRQWQITTETGQPFELEYRIRKNNQKQDYIWFLAQARALRGEDGNISKWFGSLTDIDVQKKLIEERAQIAIKEQAALAIRDSENRFRALFESAFHAIIGMDAEARVTDWNPQAERIFGWSREEALGQLFEDLILPFEERGAHRQGIEHYKKTGAGNGINRSVKVYALKKDGQTVPIQLAITPIRIHDTFIFTAFAADITEREQYEANLQRAREEAERAAQAKSEFLANMSHEIRTPLNGIIGMTDLILETPLEAHQRKYAEIIQTSSVGLLAIINDVLDFSKIEARRLDLEIVDFDLEQLIENQVELFFGKAREKDLAVMTFVDPEIAFNFRGDSGRIGQILSNLISNAIKFTTEGFIIVQVSPLARNGNRVDLKFTVRDTGIGVPPESRERLFQPFTQADGSTARRYGGTGLGLSISKKLVELMGGEIGLEESFASGSSFWFRLNLELSQNKKEPLQIPAVFSNRRVLIVDDEPLASEIIRHYLESWGLQAQINSQPTEVVELMKKENAKGKAFDLVIIDKRMPKLDGFQLARLIKSDPDLRETPLILLTAFDQPSQAEEAREYGFSVCLTKPARQIELYRNLVAVLQGRHHLSEEKERQFAPVIVPSVPRPGRVLVVEDNVVNQMVATAMLQGMGYAVQAVANGQEALDALSGSAYDAVLMDCQMPEMDGYEATRKIRDQEAASGKHQVVIALTANAMKVDEQKCIDAGMDDFLAKPIKKENLESTLKRWLQNS